MKSSPEGSNPNLLGRMFGLNEKSTQRLGKLALGAVIGAAILLSL